MSSLHHINVILYHYICPVASQVFESTPHNRPDIPVSFWSRFVFSEEYLKRINPNLALNIYTAVLNPITSDGRLKIARGGLLHKDMRGALVPDTTVSSNEISAPQDRAKQAVTIPVVVLQCTEDVLVNAANVDPFLSGRKAHHLWSHMQNVLPDSGGDSWVGKRSTGPGDYARCSLLGKTGLRMLLSCLADSRGAFVMWVRGGHAIQQENKTALLDLLDILVHPTEEYCGVGIPEKTGAEGTTAVAEILEKEKKEEESLGVIFKINPPKRVKDRRKGKDAAVSVEPAASVISNDAVEDAREIEMKSK